MDPPEFIYMRPELFKRARKHFRDILQDSDCKSFVQVVGDYHEFIGPTLSGRLNPRRGSRSSFSSVSSPTQNRTRPPSAGNNSIDPPPAFPYSPGNIRSWVAQLAAAPAPTPPPPTTVGPILPSLRVRQAWSRYGEGHDIEKLRDHVLREPIQFLEDVRHLLVFVKQDSGGKRVESWVEKAYTLASRLLDAFKVGLKRRAAQLEDERRRSIMMAGLRGVETVNSGRKMENEGKRHSGVMVTVREIGQAI